MGLLNIPFRIAARMDNERKAIYERVRARMKELGIGWPGGLAEALDVESQNVHNWGKRGVPPTMHGKVAAALGWTVNQLLGVDAPADRDGWPFPNIPEHRYRRLEPPQQLVIQAAMLEALLELEAAEASTSRPRRRSTRSRAA